MSEVLFHDREHMFSVLEMARMPEMRECSKCGESKPLDAFNWSRTTPRSRSGKPELGSVKRRRECRVCQSIARREWLEGAA